MIKIGIIGPGKIAHSFMKGMQEVSGAKVIGCASRTKEKAEAFKNEFNLDKAYDNYEDLVNDNDVDAVYIATPPQVHKEQVLLCLNHHKHVLCEKPFLLNNEDLDECFEIAKENNLLLMEAQKGVFGPVYNQIAKWINENQIGKVRYMEASFCKHGEYSSKPWLFDGKVMGGAMYDVGVYPLTYMLSLMNKHEVIESTGLYLPNENKTCDIFEQILIKFDNDVIGSARGSIDINTDNTIHIYGDKGYIVANEYWKGHDVSLVINNDKQDVHFDFNSEFNFEIQHFVECINKGCLESPIMDKKMSGKIVNIINKVNKDFI